MDSITKYIKVPNKKSPGATSNEGYAVKATVGLKYLINLERSTDGRNKKYYQCKRR